MLEAGVLPVPEPDDPRPRFRLTITKREPAVKILHSVTGLEPLSWSEDHRLSVCTSRCLSLLEVLCDGNGSALELTLHRTSLPIPATSCTLRVGVPEDVERCKEGFAMARDPKISHSFMLDRVFSPVGKFLPPLQGFKYASWSPMGCDENGRCLVAALTLDNRLTVYANLNRLSWRQLVDLTEMYGDHLFEAKYNVHDNDTTSADLGDFTEFKQRHSMQTPVRMEWSGICTTQQIMQNNECKDVGTVLLAVLFENGDIAVWQFQLPFLGKESVISCNTIMSGLNSASVLAWWEYEHSSRKMSGLIVGSSLGPIKILPVNLKAVKGYFTLRQPVVLWQEMDHMPVHCIKSIALNHPYQKCSCSLVVAARGSYVFWCLLLISKAGLNVHNSHVTGLHSLPIISMSVDKQNGTIYTCSVDGKVRQLIPIFTDVALKFEHQLIQLSDLFGVVRSHGISVSPCGAYLACITSEGMRNGIHPVNKTYQVQFVALKTFEEAVAQLLECSNPNLYRQMDLIDLVRWKILKDRVIPQFLQEALDKKLEGSSPYFWRFRLFLLRVWYQSLKKSCSESLWKPSQRDLKALKVDETLAGSSETEEQRGSDGESPSKQTGGKSPSNLSKDGIEVDIGSPSEEEGLREIQQKIESVESHLTREHMKRVLGEVYMHTLITENTSVPTRGICDFLTSNKDCTDRAAKVIIGHIEKKMNKQTFPEHCSLCKEVLTFNDSRKAVCAKGHLWPRAEILTLRIHCSNIGFEQPVSLSLIRPPGQRSQKRNPSAIVQELVQDLVRTRCFLTFQACQNLMYRRCLLHDSIARHPVPEDPEWIKKLLRGPCILCDAPVF